MTAAKQDQDKERYSLGAKKAGELLHVGPKRMSTWARDGKIPFELTPGGHRRYRPSDIAAFAETSAADLERRRRETVERLHGNGKP